MIIEERKCKKFIFSIFDDEYIKIKNISTNQNEGIYEGRIFKQELINLLSTKSDNSIHPDNKTILDFIEENEKYFYLDCPEKKNSICLLKNKQFQKLRIRMHLITEQNSETVTNPINNDNSTISTNCESFPIKQRNNGNTLFINKIQENNRFNQVKYLLDEIKTGIELVYKLIYKVFGEENMHYYNKLLTKELEKRICNFSTPKKKEEKKKNEEYFFDGVYNNSKFEITKDEQLSAKYNDVINLTKSYMINTNQKFKLTHIYNSKIDGDSSEEFHKKCDIDYPTLTIINTTKGLTLGAFTTVNLKSPEYGPDFKRDDKAFLFNLEAKQVFQIRHPKHAVLCSKENLIDFGTGSDLVIKDNFLSNNTSYTENSDTYSMYSDYQLNNGEKFIKIKSIDVYSLIIN